MRKKQNGSGTEKLLPELTETIRRRIAGQTGSLTDDDVRSMIAQEILSGEKTRGLPLERKTLLAENVFCSLRRGLGILEPLAEDETVSEIMVNGPDAVFVERAGRIEPVDLVFQNGREVEEIARRLAAKVHREINELNPIVDARMEDGSRFHCVYRNVAINGPVLNIRRFPKRSIDAEKLIRTGCCTQESMEFLRSAVEAGYNVFVSGGTSSGKTTLLNCLCDFVPQNERIIVIEDSAELQIQGIPNVVRMEVKEANSREKGAVTMADLIRSSLRMRPDRIIVGEVRGAEVLDMIQAMNTGHDGSLSTGHGNSPRGMLGRLEAMYLTAASYPIEAIRRQIGDAIDLIVHLERLPDGTRHITEIVEITGILNDEYQINRLFQYKFNTGLLPTGHAVRKREKFDRRGIRPGGNVSLDEGEN